MHNWGEVQVGRRFTVYRDKKPWTALMTAQLPSLIAARRMAYAKKLMQRRQAVKAHERENARRVACLSWLSICALTLLLMFGLFLASAN